MQVSVVIPNHNHARTLPLVLDSVYAQTRPVAQVVVVDDASTDGSLDVLRGYPCEVVALTVNRGVSTARNRGAGAATGDVLFFLDADTALAPDAVANAVRVLEREPDVGCVHGLISVEPLIDDGPVERYRVLHHHVGRLRAVGLVSTAFFAHAAIRRAVFEEVGPFDPGLRDNEDVEYSDRLARRTLIRLSADVVGYHDDVQRLWPLLTETFRRSRHQATGAAAHRLRPGAVKGNSLLGVLAAPLVPATLPLALLGPWWLGVPAGWAALFAVANPRLSLVALRTRGVGFLLFVTGAHFLVHLALWAGAVRGALRLLRPRAVTRPAEEGA